MAEPDDHTWQARLALCGVDAGRAAREGALSQLDPPRFYPTLGQVALVEEMLETGRPGLRLAADAEAALGYLGEAGYRRVEQEMEYLCAARPVTLLCQLRADTTGGQEPVPSLPAVIDAHPQALHGGCVTISRDCGGVRLVGELDRGCSGLVEAVLGRAARRAARRVARRGGKDCGSAAKMVVVDVSGLDFMDVAGFRALLAGTEQWRERGGILVLAGARGTARRVIEIIGGKDRGDVILR